MYSKLKKILTANGYDNIVRFLSEDLTESELNSLLLEVFRDRVSAKNASQVLKAYIDNRFTFPSSIDPIKNLEIETKILKILEKVGFEILEFSPLSPLGTSGIHNTVNQNNIVSGLRRTEVVSDITNVMALELAKRIRESSESNSLNIAASHRLVRAQEFKNPGYTAHFKVIGLSSSWLDKGHYVLAEKNLIKHINTYIDIFHNVYQIPTEKLCLSIETSLMGESVNSRIQNSISEKFNDLKMRFTENTHGDSSYYSNIRFGIKLTELDIPIVDGGMVNWMSTLTQNKKQRLLISGIGTELMSKINIS